jgi:hypothetical protein
MCADSIRAPGGNQRTIGQVFLTQKYFKSERLVGIPYNQPLSKHKREKYLPHESKSRGNLCH